MNSEGSSSSRTTKREEPTRRRLPRMGTGATLVATAVLTVIAGIILLVVVEGARGGGGPGTDFEPGITETQSKSGGEPFQGGPRLHFPVESIDFGVVPLNTDVSYAFAMTNVGDAEAQIDDVKVRILEGC